MNGRSIGALLVILAVGVTMLSCGRYQQEAVGTAQVAPAQWEYKVIMFAEKDTAELIEKKMNELGKDGWESAGVVTSNTAPTSFWSTFAFKRAKR